MKNEQLNTEESLAVISSMIARVKTSSHDSGVLSILWGVVITFCSLLTWAKLHYNFSLPFDIWYLTGIAVIPSVIISMKESKARGFKSYDQIAMDAVWMIFGFGMFLVIHININVHMMVDQLKDMVEQAGGARPSLFFGEYTSAYLLIMYGIPTLVTAAIKKFKPMYIGGIICWVSSVLAVYTPMEIDMLLMAVAAIAAWLIPGLILSKKCRIKKPASNV